jgi:hypothetical protein
MTDQTPNDTNNLDQSTVANVSDDAVHNFSWWLCMLPFFAAIGFFVWRWFQDKTDGLQLMYAAGALIIGLVFTGVIAGAGASIDAEAKADANK